MNFLEEILTVKRDEVNSLKKRFSISAFESMELFNKKCSPLYDALSVFKSISLIAEIKKASPSKGIIRKDFDHLEIANSYIKSVVDAISILTDEIFFKGNIKFISDVRMLTSIPLLRKDFLIDEIQLFEAKAFGADAVLLISEILTKNQISDLTNAASKLGLNVLLELHSINQLDKIDFTINNIIGINNRNLLDFKTDIKTTEEIKRHLPKDVIVVSESGISSKDDFTFLKKQNINAVLIGEHFMKSKNVYSEVIKIKSWCQYEN